MFNLIQCCCGWSYIWLKQKRLILFLRGCSRYYSLWERIERVDSFQECRRVNFPEVLIRGLIFIKFTSWWLCRSFCTWPWKELQTCPNLLPCRTAPVKKTEALAPSAAQMSWDGGRPKLPYGVVCLFGFFFFFKHASGFKGGKSFSAPHSKHALLVHVEREGGRRGLTVSEGACCSFPSFVPHQQWHRFPWRPQLALGRQELGRTVSRVTPSHRWQPLPVAAFIE